MAKIELITDEIYCLKEKIPGPAAIFAIYFIKDGAGAILEPGPAALVPKIQEAVKELGLSEPAYVIPTHIHLDHAGGVGRLAEVFPNTKIVLNKHAVRHMVEPSKLINSTRMAFGDNFEEIYGPILPVPQARLKVVEDGERLALGSRELNIIYTPGHAPHHISIFDSKTGGLVAGEALGLIYGEGYPPLPAVAPPSFDLELYLGDMQRLKALKPKFIFYSHGGVGNEPEMLISTVIENTKLVGDFILRHLRMGEGEEVVIRYVGEYLREKFAVSLDKYELESNVKGYIHYFRKKGLA